MTSLDFAVGFRQRAVPPPLLLFVARSCPGVPNTSVKRSRDQCCSVLWGRLFISKPVDYPPSERKNIVKCKNLCCNLVNCGDIFHRLENGSCEDAFPFEHVGTSCSNNSLTLNHFLVGGLNPISQ